MSFRRRRSVASEAELFGDAVRFAEFLRDDYPDCSPAKLATFFGISIVSDIWQVANGQIIYLAECRMDPDEIRLNQSVICQIAQLAQREFSPGEQAWATAAQITEVIVAHELFHILKAEPACPLTENAAHVFVETWLGMPFSPLRYQHLLQAAIYT